MNSARDIKADPDWLVERIHDGYDPENIILFGSLVRGETREWSDIDVIVVKDTDASYGQRVKALTPLIQDRLNGADILVYSLKEYENARRKGSPFLSEAERDGAVLYERHS